MAILLVNKLLKFMAKRVFRSISSIIMTDIKFFFLLFQHKINCDKFFTTDKLLSLLLKTQIKSFNILTLMLQAKSIRRVEMVQCCPN